MRWSKTGSLLMAAVLCLALIFSVTVPEQQLTVYTSQNSYSLSVLDRDGKAYIGVTDLLSPVGASATKNKGKEWKINISKVEARLTEGKDKATIQGTQVDLGGKVLVENGRALVPLSAALPLLARLLNTTVDFHQPSRRIFVGNALIRFSATLHKGETTSLVLNFTQPVKPEITHDADRTVLTFRKEPVMAEANHQQFSESAIQSLVFAEENGTASLTIAGNAPLTVNRSDDGKSITLQTEPVVKQQPPATENAPVTAESHKSQDFFVMIDPSHGGYDKGVNFGGKVVEKDVALRLARELRKELQERGIPSRMLRDSDVDIALERRAEITNEQHAGLYVALHAGRPGKGVRVYAPLLADSQPPAAGRFLPWESAQSGALSRSKSAAQTISTELRKKGLAVANLGMPVRPLNNIVVPAIAIELAPENDDPLTLENAKRQNLVASAIAAGIAQAHSQIGSRQ